MTPRVLKCAQCGKVFESSWTDEDALAEFRANFGREPNAQDDAVICHECYVKLFPGGAT